MSDRTGQDNQTPEWYQEQLGSYALDALSPEEKAEFEARLATSPELRNELRALRIAVKAYGLVAEERAPSAQLRDRLLAAISAEPNFRASTSAPSKSVERPIETPVSLIDFKAARGWTINPLLGKIAAALAVVLIGSLLAWNFSLQGDNDDLREQVVGQSLAEFGSLDPAVPSTATGEVVYRADSDLFTLDFQNLPELPEGQVYQLWFIAGTDAPIPSVAFRPDNIGVGETRIAVVGDPDTFDLFALTVEPGPTGSAAPTTAPILGASV